MPTAHVPDISTDIVTKRIVDLLDSQLIEDSNLGHRHPPTLPASFRMLSSSVAEKRAGQSPTQQEPKAKVDKGEASSLATKTELSNSVVSQGPDHPLEGVKVDVYVDVDLEAPKMGAPPSLPQEEAEIAFHSSFFYQGCHPNMASPPHATSPCERAQQYLQEARIVLCHQLHYQHPLISRTTIDGSLEDDAWSGAFEPLCRMVSHSAARFMDTDGWVDGTRAWVVEADASDEKAGKPPKLEWLSDLSSDAEDW